ncbi:hypothetical protein [Kordia sp.]|uniref:hypothetical protein n=1 Tax=Kordia sp. TaxID=1965332 RepID=UPI003D6B02E1
MKKKELNNKLKFNKVEIAKLEQRNILGGDGRTREYTCATIIYKCSAVYCYTLACPYSDECPIDKTTLSD